MALVTFYGPLGDVMGRERTLPLPEGVRTPLGLLSHLAKSDGAFRDVVERVQIKVAVNDVLVDANSTINDADEIAFLPPFSGG